MRNYTSSGDLGETALPGNERLPKTDLRVCLCGDLDELNSVLGLAGSLTDDAYLLTGIRNLQCRIFEMSADVASLGTGLAPPRIGEAQVEQLDRLVTPLQAQLSPLNSFILPGGPPVAAALHVARTVCRRAERTLVALAAERAVPPPYLSFLNRLSDVLFLLARTACARAGIPETTWSEKGTSQEHA